MSRGRSTLCVVQARTGSTRLPGKVLQELGGRPLLQFMLDRLADLRVDEVVVATSTLARDDAVAEIARAAGRAVLRGSESDVLDRFADALLAHPADHVVRLTADCPLIDPALVEAVIARHLDRGADYTSNVFPRTFPRGLDCEVMTGAALQTAHTEAVDAIEREHVTPFLYRRPERFSLANLRNDAPLGRERWTVDTVDDLTFVREIVNAMNDDLFGWRQAWKVVGPRSFVDADAVVLVPAGRENSAFFLACRNDIDAVQHSRSRRPIGREEHARWFAAKIDDPGVRLRLASVRGDPVGTVRVDVRSGVGDVGLAVAPTYRGQGLGTAMLEALVDDVGTDPQVVALTAVVHVGNTASMRAFARVGFVADGSDGEFRRFRRELGEIPAGTDGVKPI
ncbi:MAG: GNAT family N-acetyltransferase [Acidimicrobiia bacterium]